MEQEKEDAKKPQEVLDKEAEEAAIHRCNLLLGLKNKRRLSRDSSRSASDTESDATIADKDKDMPSETAGLSNNEIVAKIYRLRKRSRRSKDTKEGKQEVKEMMETFKAVGSQMAEAMTAISTAIVSADDTNGKDKETDLRLKYLEKQMKEESELVRSRVKKNEQALALILSKLQ